MVTTERSCEKSSVKESTVTFNIQYRVITQEQREAGKRLFKRLVDKALCDTEAKGK